MRRTDRGQSGVTLLEACSPETEKPHETMRKDPSSHVVPTPLKIFRCITFRINQSEVHVLVNLREDSSWCRNICPGGQCQSGGVGPPKLHATKSSDHASATSSEVYIRHKVERPSRSLKLLLCHLQNESVVSAGEEMSEMTC